MVWSIDSYPPMPNGHANRMERRWTPKVGEKITSNRSAITRQWFLPWLESLVGETAEMKRVYRRMMKHPVIKAATSTKVLGVASLERQVNPPEGNSPRDREAVKFIEHNMDRLSEGFAMATIQTLQHMLIDGWQLSEKVWGIENRGKYEGKIVLERLAPKDPEDIRIEVDRFNNVSGFADAIQPDLWFPKRDFVYSRYMPMYDNPYGLSDFRAAYGPYWMEDTVTKLRVMGQEKNVSGVLIGEYPDDGGDSQSSLEEALENIRTGTWASIPEGTRVYALDLALGSDANYKSFIGDQQEQMLIAIVGAYLQTLEGQIQDARGDTKVQKSIVELYQWLLVVIIQEIWNRQIIPDLIDFNYPGCGYPKLTLGGVNEKDLQDRLQTLQGANQLVPLSKKSVYTDLSIQRPDPNDPDDLIPAANAQQGMGLPPDPFGGGGGMGGGGAFPFSEPKKASGAGDINTSPAGFIKTVFEAMIDLEIARQEGTIEEEKYQSYRAGLEELLDGGRGVAVGAEVDAFSWTAGQTRKKTLKAIGTGEHQGKVLYGKAAREALTEDRRLSFKRDYTRTQTGNKDRQGDAEFNRQNLNVVRSIAERLDAGTSTSDDHANLAFRITRLPLADLKSMKQRFAIDSTYLRTRGDHIAVIRDYLEKRNAAGRTADPGTLNGTPDGGDDRRTPIGEPLGRIITARPQFTKPADPRVVPERLREKLRSHQVEATASAIDSMDKNSAFILADGAGTGKTSVQLATAQAYADRGKKVLIVTQNIALRPNFGTGEITGSFKNDSERMGVSLSLNDGNNPLLPGRVNITTYDTLAAMKDKVNKETVLILDEAHSLKNKDSNRTIAGQAMLDQAGQVMYNTATPADQPLQLAYLLKSKFLGDKSTEQALKVLGSWDNTNPKKLPQLYEAVGKVFDELTARGVMLKREISMDGVKVAVRKLAIDPEDEKRLAQIQADLAAKYPKAPGIVKALALAQQREEQERFKVPEAVNDIERDLKAGKQAVVFVSRVSAGEDGTPGTPQLIREALAARGITDVVELHGNSNTPAKEAMDSFQSGKARVIISTIASGGTGINLDDDIGDRPRTLTIVTPPFSAVENTQAVGRVWRLNSRSYPEVRFMLTDSPVDRWNAELIQKKMGLLNATVGGEVPKIGIPQFAEQDWEGPIKGQRGGTLWRNRKSGEIEYSQTNPGAPGGSGDGENEPKDQSDALNPLSGLVQADSEDRREGVEQVNAAWSEASSSLPDQTRSEVGGRLGQLARATDEGQVKGWLRSFADWLISFPAEVLRTTVHGIVEMSKRLLRTGAGVAIHMGGIALAGAAIVGYGAVAPTNPALFALGAWPAASVLKSLVTSISGYGQQVAAGKRFNVVGNGFSEGATGSETPAVEMSLPGAEGRKAMLLLANANRRGQLTLEAITRRAVKRIIDRGSNAIGVSLFDMDELKALASAIGAANATADLLGRARVRERMQQGDIARLGLKKFSEDECFQCFADPSLPAAPMEPNRALEWFKALVPEVNPGPGFAPGIERNAFTLAVDADRVVLGRVKGVIENFLRTGQGSARDVQQVLDEAGVSKVRPGYAELVFRTNVMQSYNRGQQEELQQPGVREYFPAWEYLNPSDSRSRPLHAERNGKLFPNTVTFDEIRGTDIKDVAECRCGMRPISRYEMEDLLASGRTLEESW